MPPVSDRRLLSCLPPESGLARRLRRRWTLTVKRAVLLVLALACIAAGIAAVPSPVPIGFVLFVMGLYFAARGSKLARRGVTALRRAVPPMSRALNAVKPRLPHAVRRFIERSDPD